MKRYIFPIILIIAGGFGIFSPYGDFNFFHDLADIVPENIQFAPMYQMIYGLILIIGIIGVVEVTITNASRNKWEQSFKKKSGNPHSSVKYRN